MAAALVPDALWSLADYVEWPGAIAGAQPSKNRT